MRYRDTSHLGVGLVAVSGGLLVIAGIWYGDTTNIVIGASVLIMCGGSLAALTASDTSQ